MKYSIGMTGGGGGGGGGGEGGEFKVKPLSEIFQYKNNSQNQTFVFKIIRKLFYAKFF